MSNQSNLLHYWSRWENKLKTLVKSRNAELHFPAMRRRVGSHDHANPDVITFELEEPILILEAPQKASSTRRTKRMHILVDGTFTFGETAGHPCLLSAGCNLTLFDPTVCDEDSSLRLVLVDAMHFDVETPDKHGNLKGFHPFFHAQRGISHDDHVIQHLFAKYTGRTPEEVHVDQSAKDTIGHPSLRIPTPQLDLFSVMTMIAADCFCNPADAPAPSPRRAVANGETRAELLFVELLRLLTEGANVVREGHTSKMLMQRVASANLMSAGHWYPECA